MSVCSSSGSARHPDSKRLANLLPGVRDLRAPLAAGYLWLPALYLAFEPKLPSRREATGIWESLAQLKDAVGTVGLGVGLSFLAYLAGSISEALATAVVSTFNRRRDAPEASTAQGAEPPFRTSSQDA